ncbi:MAG: ArnT family glycosyltransferase [Terriglobales bacterium]
MINLFRSGMEMSPQASQPNDPLEQSGVERHDERAALPHTEGKDEIENSGGAFFIATLALFAMPAVIALTTYPHYYEDESWLYLAVFERLRGNGFSWAAFHEGSSIFFTFNAIGSALFALSPFSTEATVRGISFLFGTCCLVGIYVLARRIAGANAYIAPVVLTLAPWFVKIRFGRMDCVALAFAIWALVAATRGFPLLAGVLSGLAGGIHPIFIWVGIVCIVLLAQARRWPDLWHYVIGAVVGILPQLAWIGSHMADFRSIAAHYFVTSSVGHGWLAWLASLAGEWRRYASVGAGVPTLVLLPFVIRAILRARGRERAVLITLTVAPLLSLAILVQGKNPYYYLVYALPALAVVSAAGVRGLPSRPTKLVCIVALCCSGIFHVYKAKKAAALPTVTRSVDLLAARIPPHAAVFSPLVYAGLVVRRPDLQFFTFHSLSRRDGWHLPPCDDIPAKIRSLLAEDPRRTSNMGGEDRDSVFFVLGPGQSEDAFLWYLRLIYVDATPADLRCIVGSQQPVPIIHVCGSDPNKCVNLYLVQRPLR